MQWIVIFIKFCFFEEHLDWYVCCAIAACTESTHTSVCVFVIIIIIIIISFSTHNSRLTKMCTFAVYVTSLCQVQM